MSRNIYLSDDRYLAVLKRLRARIANGLPFKAHDDDTPGDKSTACSWGLCSDDRAAWPNAEDHLWPDEFTNGGRVAPLYRQRHHRCPIDTRNNADLLKSGNGCFHTCAHFSKHYTLTREQVLARYDEQISHAEGRK